MGTTQRRILGVAHTVNAHTRGGVASVKSDVPAKSWGGDAVIWEGTPDITTDLGMYAVYRLVPDPRPARRTIRGLEITFNMYGMLWNLRRHPKAERARYAVSKALASLRARGMMRRAVSRDERCQFGHLLTADGLEVGRIYAAEIPHIDLAIKVFMARSRIPPWTDYRDELIRRLISPIVPRPWNATPARDVESIVGFVLGIDADGENLTDEAKEALVLHIRHCEWCGFCVNALCDAIESIPPDIGKTIYEAARP
jgi:hypothetical protein